MGMTIDDSERYLRLMLGGMKYAVKYWEDKDKEESDIEQTNVEAVKTALDTMRKYQQLQADYETRLKADMAAMLDEIQLQAEENIENFYEKDEDDLLQLAQHNAFADCFEQYNDLIQQKINALKGDPQ